MFISEYDLGFEYCPKRCHSQQIVKLLLEPAPLGTKGKAQPDEMAALLSAAVCVSGGMSQLNAVAA